jgi:hypothetical protein
VAFMRAAEIQERSLVIACTALCVSAAAIGWFINPGELTLPLALVSLVPPLGVAIARAARNGMVDPLAVFALCFAAYNGVLLVRMNYGVDPHETPFAANGPMFFHAGILSGLGSLGLVVGWLVSKNKRPEPMTQGSPSQCTASFITGSAFYLMGIVLYMVQYWQVGGYMQSVAMDRGQRFEMLTHAVSMPFEGFILSGLSLMVYASIDIAKSRLILSYAACLLWLGLVLLQGDRRLALQMIMAMAVVIGTLRPKTTKLRPVALLYIAAAYSVAVMFGQYRTLIYDLAAGRSTLKQAQVAAQSEESIMGKPEDSELGGPYVSVLYYSRGTEALRWGSSYAMSIPAVVPKALYPGAKMPAISADLDQALYEGVGPVYGWGFSPIAEGFANFGLVGSFGVMVLWSIFFAWLGSKRYRGLAGMVVCATLLQEAVNANRIDFRYVYFESFYCASVGIIAVMMMKAVAEITDRGSDPVRRVSSRALFIAARRSNST